MESYYTAEFYRLSLCLMWWGFGCNYRTIFTASLFFSCRSHSSVLGDRSPSQPDHISTSEGRLNYQALKAADQEPRYSRLVSEYVVGLHAQSVSPRPAKTSLPSEPQMTGNRIAGLYKMACGPTSNGSRRPCQQLHSTHVLLSPFGLPHS